MLYSYYLFRIIIIKFIDLSFLWNIYVKYIKSIIIESKYKYMI